MKKYYRKPTLENWQGRVSQTRDYIHERVGLLDLSEGVLPKTATPEPALIGYACDAGIKRNLGRIGASRGPLALRNSLGKMPWPGRAEGQLWDAGDVSCPDDNMEGAQECFGMYISRLLQQGYFPVGIGGGHDIAYAHYSGIRDFLGRDKKLGIVNFDAHLDLRLPGEKGHSGSPFYQIATQCKEQNTEFLYACVGLREDANPRELTDRAADLGVLCLDREVMEEKHREQSLQRLHAFTDKADAIYVTIDLDGFSSAFAPGVSAASPMGFSPASFMPFYRMLLNSGKVISMDLAELSPGFDRDAQTAILAASLCHKAIHFKAHSSQD